MHEEAEETFAFLTFPKIKPEKVIGDFLESKLNERILKKYPEWDLPRIDPKVNLVSARRDLHKAEVRLSSKRVETEGRRKYLVEEWDKLEKEQAKFKQTFCEFDKMIEENSHKTHRAISKKKERVAFGAETDGNIKRFEVEHARLLKIKEHMEAQVKDHCIYDNYLLKVVEAKPDEFRSAQDVFNKFASLDEARNALAERLNANIIKMEDVKDQLEQQIIEENTVLTGLNNRVATLHTRYRAAKDRSQKWDDIVNDIQDSLCKKYAELLSVRRTCWNIYTDMCERKRTKPTIARHNFEEQLLYIHKFFVSLQKTIANAQNALEADANSVLVEKPASPKLHKF